MCSGHCPQQEKEVHQFFFAGTTTRNTSNKDHRADSKTKTTGGAKESPNTRGARSTGLAEGRLSSEVLANIGLVKDHQGRWVKRAAVLRGLCCKAKSCEHQPLVSHSARTTTTDNSHAPRGTLDMLNTTTPLCCCTPSVIRPRPDFDTWLPYRNDISALGFSHTLC